jgi:FMN phosphatase YigB (HAD superfamily)
MGRKEELAKTLNQLEIDTALFDCDDTIIKGGEFFTKAILEISTILSDGKRDIKETENTFRGVLYSLKNEFCVNPAIMYLSAQITAKLLSVDEKTLEIALKKVDAVYSSDKYELITGAQETVDLFSTRKVLVTHGDIVYTGHKLKSVGMAGAFDRVCCVRVNQLKGPQISEVIRREKINPKHSITIGDNRFADILPFLELGGRLGVWIRGKGSPSFNVDTENEELWMKYFKQGKILVAPSIAEVPEVIRDVIL